MLCRSRPSSPMPALRTRDLSTERVTAPASPRSRRWLHSARCPRTCSALPSPAPGLRSRCRRSTDPPTHRRLPVHSTPLPYQIRRQPVASPQQANRATPNPLTIMPDGSADQFVRGVSISLQLGRPGRAESHQRRSRFSPLVPLTTRQTNVLSGRRAHRRAIRFRIMIPRSQSMPMARS